MVTETLADAMQVFFVDNTGLSAQNHSLNDLQFKYYSDRSGLTPIWKYSLVDHMRAFFISLLGTSKESVDHLEENYYRLEGAVGISYDDVKYDYYTNRSGGLVFVTDLLNGTININTNLAPVETLNGVIRVDPPGHAMANPSGEDGTVFFYL